MGLGENGTNNIKYNESDVVAVLEAFSHVSDKETNALCRMGKEKYLLNISKGSDEWWEENHDHHPETDQHVTSNMNISRP